jgi:predicted nucleic acid-binding Zn ribbon protein
MEARVEQHTCSECARIIPPERKTCSDPCRSKRSRRLRRERKANALAALEHTRLAEHQQALADVVAGKVPDVANEVMKEELRPIVRDSITGDVLNSLKALVGLAPQAIAALALDLQSPDDQRRQKAYELWFRYTVGQQKLHSPDDAADGARNISIHFDMPRPDDGSEEAITDEAVELRECEHCAIEKPLHDFIEGSTRCQLCHESLLADVQAVLGEDED